MKKQMPVWCSLLFLAACGGGGSNQDTYESYVPSTPTTYTAAQTLSLAQIEHINLASSINASDIPNGTYTFNGYALFADGNDFPTQVSSYGLVSNMTMVANFQDNSVTGAMYNFLNSSGGLTGSVNITGSINGAEVNASTSGVLSQSGFTAINEGSLTGKFVGAHASGAKATGVGGTMSGSSGSSNYVGIFTGER